MPQYKKMYLRLFNRITDALEKINQRDVVAAKEILMQAQIETEEMYIANDSEEYE